MFILGWDFVLILQVGSLLSFFFLSKCMHV